MRCIMLHLSKGLDSNILLLKLTMGNSEYDSIVVPVGHLWRTEALLACGDFVSWLQLKLLKSLLTLHRDANR